VERVLGPDPLGLGLRPLTDGPRQVGDQRAAHRVPVTERHRSHRRHRALAVELEGLDTERAVDGGPAAARVDELGLAALEGVLKGGAVLLAAQWDDTELL